MMLLISLRRVLSATCPYVVEAPAFFNKDESPDTLRAMAERMPGVFRDAVRPGEILAVEESFAVEPVEGILVTGIVDLVEVKDGRI